MLMVKKVLITGAAGFIGSFLSQRLLKEGYEVVGIDNLNDYYDVQLKRDRLSQLEGESSFRFIKLDLADREGMASLFEQEQFSHVVNLGAQAGVRYSIINPHAYVDSNISGFINVLEGCRHNDVKHLVYASSSSVYGANTQMPFSTHDNVSHPVSMYAATKKANELMAHSYSHLYGLATTGLRFFTVYGPWGRPDMAYFLFADAIFSGKPIKIFNNGEMMRDFTYIDDVVEGVSRVLEQPAHANPTWQSLSPDSASSYAPYKLYNIGNHSPIKLMDFIQTIEHAIGRKAIKEMLPMQAGDLVATYAEVDELINDVGFQPSTSIETGINNFIEWYRGYYKK